MNISEEMTNESNTMTTNPPQSKGEPKKRDRITANLSTPRDSVPKRVRKLPSKYDDFDTTISVKKKRKQQGMSSVSQLQAETPDLMSEKEKNNESNIIESTKPLSNNTITKPLKTPEGAKFNTPPKTIPKEKPVVTVPMSKYTPPTSTPTSSGIKNTSKIPVVKVESSTTSTPRPNTIKKKTHGMSKKKRMALLARLKKYEGKIDTIIESTPTKIKKKKKVETRGRKKKKKITGDEYTPPVATRKRTMRKKKTRIIPVKEEKKEKEKRVENGNSKKDDKRSKRFRKSSSKIHDTQIAHLEEPVQKCYKLLQKLISHRWSWPFVKPVDIVELNIPDYFTIIKRPMDLGTVNDNLLGGDYSFEKSGKNGIYKFANDVRTVWTNCFTYNPPEHDIVKMARSLDEIFEDKFKKICKSYNLMLEKEKRRELEEEKETKSKKKGEKKIASKEKKIGKKVKTETTEKEIKNWKKNSQKLPSTSFPVETPMSFQEKQRLSSKISQLSPEKIARVVEIIQSRAPKASTQASATDIEIDLSKLDEITLRQIEKCVNSTSTPKRRKRKENDKKSNDKKSENSLNNHLKEESDSSSGESSGDSDSDSSDESSDSDSDSEMKDEEKKNKPKSLSQKDFCDVSVDKSSESIILNIKKAILVSKQKKKKSSKKKQIKKRQKKKIEKKMNSFKTDALSVSDSKNKSITPCITFSLDHLPSFDNLVIGSKPDFNLNILGTSEAFIFPKEFNFEQQSNGWVDITNNNPGLDYNDKLETEPNWWKFKNQIAKEAQRKNIIQEAISKYKLLKEEKIQLEDSKKELEKQNESEKKVEEVIEENNEFEDEMKDDEEDFSAEISVERYQQQQLNSGFRYGMKEDSEDGF